MHPMVLGVDGFLFRVLEDVVCQKDDALDYQGKIIHLHNALPQSYKPGQNSV